MSYSISTLKYYRQKNRLTIRRLSQVLKIPYSSLCQLEAQEWSIRMETAVRLSQFFDAPISQFVGKKKIELTPLEQTLLFNSCNKEKKRTKFMDFFLMRKN